MWVSIVVAARAEMHELGNHCHRVDRHSREVEYTHIICDGYAVVYHEVPRHQDVDTLLNQAIVADLCAHRT